MILIISSLSIFEMCIFFLVSGWLDGCWRIFDVLITICINFVTTAYYDCHSLAGMKRAFISLGWEGNIWNHIGMQRVFPFSFFVLFLFLV